MSGSSELKPIISKAFCSSTSTTLMVRMRPHVVHGGGFVVTNCSYSSTVFTVDGCGVIGTKGELIIRDADGASILRIEKKDGAVQVMSSRSQWKGYIMDNEEPNKLVFTLREPRKCISRNDVKRICIEPKGFNKYKEWDFEIHGSFVDRVCTINDFRGNVVAQVSERMGSKEFYQVLVQPGYDKAFVVGVIAVLDYINGESTRC